MIIEGESQEEEKVNNGKPKTLVYCNILYSTNVSFLGM